MKRHLIVFLSFFFVINTSCRKKNNDPNENPTGEIFYTNASIYTVNPNQPWADAMLIKNGKIIAIGKETDIENQVSEEASIIDLKNKFIMPGIHDVHMHPLEAASENFKFVLDEQETDPENYAITIQEALSSNANVSWLLGWGYDLHTLLGATRDPIKILDDISSTKPIAVMELSSHSIWVNTAALVAAGITKTTPNPTGGIYMKNSSGDLNGVLIDNAGNKIIELAINSIPNNELNDYDGLVNFALPELAKHGITSICDARSYWKRNHHKTWKKAADNNTLTCRVNLGLWAYPEENDATQLATLKSLFSNNPNKLLRINQIKLYSDGIIHNTTSAMHADYKIDLFGLPTNKGLNYFSETRLGNYIAQLEPLGFDFHIHAIGNRGVHEALNAIATNGSNTGRHRLTHVEYVDAVDIPRFANLNVTADAQVTGDFAQPAHWHDNDTYIDASLNNSVIPIRSLIQANARLTLSSDWDVSPLNPFMGIQRAVTRAPQNISLEEAIKAYTINAAYVMRQEDKVGTLEVGKEADFIILDQNIISIPVTSISSTQVLETFLQGEQVYKK